MSKIEELVNDHWEHIQAFLENEYRDVEDDITLKKDDYIKRIQFHYTTAFKEGYKHGEEDREMERQWEESTREMMGEIREMREMRE